MEVEYTDEEPTGFTDEDGQEWEFNSDGVGEGLVLLLS
jgi:hypothetical protein